ncbi:5'-3' exonuclease [Candidatus Nesciobacter abundans]|uniref:5'-3' exonuclease domain-containing protein n=1 Tax=Candidatus Nesciobacter abundans TaxID=2601668 RepID=A0A5C0UHG7_9PROT|nr:5'-3' exonuclease H3TH domain-containing protein [Candidatus Nesciobacter abundans]QEK39003.1 hypothetical protein FZC36_00950 [Candidatus Nesciobacter abundans]
MDLVILDGFSILFRNFFGMSSLYNSEGLPIGGAVGFLNTIFKVMKKYRPDYICIALDSGEKTWRHNLYSDYKSNRKKTPEDLIPQFPIIHEMCETLNLNIFKGGECEADDWIGSISKKYQSNCSNVVVCSCDKDLMQLVENNVFFVNPFKFQKMYEEDVVEKMGVSPNQIPDLFGLTGDASDCIPGVPNVGAKTASSWLNEFKTLEGVIDNLGHLKPLSRRGSLSGNIEQAHLSKTLATLKLDLDLPEIHDLKTNYDKDLLLDLIRKYKMEKHIRF